MAPFRRHSNDVNVQLLQPNNG